MRLEISRSLLAEIHAAAAADRREICGLLFGDNTAVTSWQQTENVHDHSDRNFEIDPSALFAALRAERAGGKHLIGYIHSHPSGRAEPSATDTAVAQPDGKLWLIVAGEAATLWRATAGGFTSVELNVSPVAAR